MVAEKQGLEVEYIGTIREFMSSEAWRSYLKPMLLSPIQQKFPEPSEKGWEEKYIYAFALATTMTSIISAIENSATRSEYEKRIKDILPIDEN